MTVRYFTRVISTRAISKRVRSANIAKFQMSMKRTDSAQCVQPVKDVAMATTLLVAMMEPIQSSA